MVFAVLIVIACAPAVDPEAVYRDNATRTANEATMQAKYSPPVTPVPTTKREYVPNIITVQMPNGDTCYVLDNSISCVR
jgi:hypothetical protein